MWNKIWSLKSLVMLKCESRTSLHAVQYKWQPGSVLIFCYKKAPLDTFFLMFCGTALWLVLNFFFQNQGFCSYKIVLIEKKRIH